MTKLAIKNLWARKVRALTTTLAVFLGIAFVSGTYVLTDTINAAFDEIFSDSLGETQVVLSAQQPVTQDTGETPSMPDSVLTQVRQLPSVDDAAGEIFATGAIFQEDGSRIGAGFAPQFIASELPGRFDSSSYEEGRPPRDSDEAALDRATAETAGLEVGDSFQVAAALPAKSYTLVGLADLGDVSFGGTSVTILTPPEAERVTDRTGRFDQVYVIGEAGITPLDLRDRIAAVVADDIRVETVEQYSERQSSEIKDSLSFIRIALLIFAGIAVFVGAFLIFNTFSITVAQRVREFGLLRTLGASRRQILGSVIAEAVLIGLIGAVTGLFGGILVAEALTAMFKAIGADLPSTGMVIALRTVLVCLGLGLAVTLLSSLAPALRSTKVSPMAALLAGDIGFERRRPWILTVVAGLLGAVGLAALIYGLVGDVDGTAAAAGLMGGGAVAVVLAVSLFSSHLVRPLAAVAGAPMRRFGGMPGVLARENTLRKPGRTAVTAAALMIGIAVVTFFSIFGAGFKATIDRAVDESFQGELVLTSATFSTIPPRAAETASEIDGVQTVAALRYSQAEVEGQGRQSFTGIDPVKAPEVIALDWVEGTEAALTELAPEQTVISQAFAESSGLQVGDPIQVLTQLGETVGLEVVGVIEDSAGLFGAAIVTQDVMTERFGAREDMIDFVALDQGADATLVQDELKAALEQPFPTVEVLNQAELKQQQSAAIDQLLFLVYALVALAIIVSLFGIANTLALSIHERTRELGMLRGIGMSRRQVRRMIRYEAVITAMIGAILGMVLGIAFAALISVPLADEGFALSFPVPALIAILVISALAGVISAIPPARRASRLNLLRAISHE